MFSCEFCEISNNTFFYRTPLVAASAESMFVIRSVALTLELLPNLLRFCTEIYLAIIFFFNDIADT